MMPQDGISSNFSNAVLSDINSVTLPDKFKLQVSEADRPFFGAYDGAGEYKGRVPVTMSDQHGNSQVREIEISGIAEKGRTVDWSGMYFNNFKINEIALVNPDNTTRPIWQRSDETRMPSAEVLPSGGSDSTCFFGACWGDFNATLNFERMPTGFDDHENSSLAGGFALIEKLVEDSVKNPMPMPDFTPSGPAPAVTLD